MYVYISRLTLTPSWVLFWIQRLKDQFLRGVTRRDCHCL